jgi:hypothetical protein
MERLYGILAFPDLEEHSDMNVCTSGTHQHNNHLLESMAHKIQFFTVFFTY